MSHGPKFLQFYFLLLKTWLKFIILACRTLTKEAALTLKLLNYSLISLCKEKSTFHNLSDPYKFIFSPCLELNISHMSSVALSWEMSLLSVHNWPKNVHNSTSNHLQCPPICSDRYINLNNPQNTLKQWRKRKLKWELQNLLSWVFINTFASIYGQEY